MDWGQVLAIAAINIGLIALLRSDMKEMEKGFNSFKEEMLKETKSFHGRLCALEEKYYQMMQRFWENK